MHVLVTLTATLILVVVCVMLHYEALDLMRRAGTWLHLRSTWHRWHLSMLVGGLLVAHALEAVLFGFAYWWIVDGSDYGRIVGADTSGVADYIYFSFVNYTSLGYGDLVPLGPLRFMAGMEALTGLALISWTASFLYLQMQRIWERRSR